MTQRETWVHYGGQAVEAGTADYASNEPQTNLVDTLTNIRHWAEHEQLDFDAASQVAEVHWATERLAYGS